MLDAGFHQAISLQRSEVRGDLRLIPIASHGAWETDQAVMWETCAALQSLGYPVAVLDGTSVESTDNLGLVDLLQDAVWDDGAAPDADSMSVIPAARGLRLLRSAPATGATPLLQFRGLLRMYRAVLVYASADTLAPLLEGTGAEALIFLPPTQKAVVSAYNSFKQLKLQTGSAATLVTVVEDSRDPTAPQQAARVQAAVRKCAQAHLGCSPRSLTVSLDDAPAVQRLALQLLENAINIGSHQSAAYPAAAGATGREARSH